MNKLENAPSNNLTCPRCQLSHIKKNGHTYYGKQNHRCLNCGRQFVEPNETVSDDTKELICRLLLERISLRGICRVLDVSLAWLIIFIQAEYEKVSDDLDFYLPERAEVEIICLEADEIWSFVHQKANKRWIWLALERTSRQIVAVYIGDRSQHSAKQLWQRIPIEVKVRALVLTDNWDAYGLAIPKNQHTACSKESGQVSLIERFNCTLRQRVSRLVRKSLSFSKSEWFHQGAIKYFIADYNRERRKSCFST